EHAASDRTVLLGQRQDVPNLLRSADLFMCWSMSEGLPNAVLEAMAAGLPIVTTDVPGCRDLIRHEQTGLLVPYGDIAATADAIERLLDDRKLAHRLGAAAQAWVTRNATVSELPPRWISFYEHIR